MIRNMYTWSRKCTSGQGNVHQREIYICMVKEIASGWEKCTSSQINVHLDMECTSSEENVPLVRGNVHASDKEMNVFHDQPSRTLFIAHIIG